VAVQEAIQNRKKREAKKAAATESETAPEADEELSQALG
jgi:hypothetical protein